MINLVDCIRKGMEAEENVIDFHNWAIDNIPEIQREFDYSAIHASDASVGLQNENQKCDRAFWYRLNDYDRKPYTLGEKIMHDHGLRIQVRFSWFIHLGLPKNYEIADIMMVIDNSAESDLVLLDPNDDYVVVEVKTLRGRAFDYLEEPRERHCLQCQSYQKRLDTDKGCVLYLDREGQNMPVQFTVERNDDKVKNCVEYAKQVAKRRKIPHKLDFAKVKIKENKTVDNAVYIDMPWQCDYCKYENIQCEGVVPREIHEISGMVGRIDDDGNFYSEDYPELEETASEYVYNSEDYQEIYGGNSNGAVSGETDEDL